MTLAPEFVEVKRLARAWRKKRGRLAELEELATAVADMADEIEKSREVIQVVVRIREDGYTDALARELADAMLRYRADAFVWKEGDVTFSHEQDPSRRRRRR